jgi:hypothetical protein
MSEKLEFAPDYWRKRAAESQRLSELIEDNFTAETLLDIAGQYNELAEHAERRLRLASWVSIAAPPPKGNAWPPPPPRGRSRPAGPPQPGAITESH